MKRSFVAHVLDGIFKKMPLRTIEDERKANAKRRPPKAPKGVAVTPVEFGGVHCEVVVKNGNANTVFYTHGGGFTAGNAKERRSLTFFVCDKLGYNVVAPDYRLAPEHKLPAAHEDCFAAYTAFAKQYPRHIVMGESAGGLLALHVVQQALEKNIAKPLAVAVFSPMVGLGLDLPSYKENLKTDFMLKRNPSCPELLDIICPEEYDEEFLKNISPCFGSFENFPPTFIAASDSEILLDDSKVLQQQLLTAEIENKLEVAHKMVHAYPAITQLPEARKTLRNMNEFIERWFYESNKPQNGISD